MKTQTETDSLTAITELIRQQQGIERESIFEIGRLLEEVKESDLTRGNFNHWLKSLGYTVRTAQRYIQINKKFRGIEEARTLPVGKLTELLALPPGVDLLPFLKQAQDIPVKVLRENVKQANRNGKGEESPQERVSPTQPQVIEQVSSNLRNLIPHFMVALSNEGISVADAVEIGKLSERAQKLLSKLNFDGKYLDEHLLVANNETSISEASRMIKLVLAVNKACDIYLDNSEFRALIDEASDLGNAGMYAPFKQKVENVYERLDEFAEKRRQRFDERFQEFDWGSFEKSTIAPEVTVEMTRLLGLSDSATADEVKTKYRKLVKILHPDMETGSAYLFDLVKKAYDDYLIVN